MTETPRKYPSVVSLDERRRDRSVQQSSERPDLFQGIPVEAPVMPTWLSADAKKHWRYMVRYLKRYNMLSRLDQGTLANLCTYYARAKEAEEYLQVEGEFQQTPNGYWQVSPFSVAFTRYSKMYNTLAKQFGMTPISRKGVQPENPNQEKLNLE